MLHSSFRLKNNVKAILQRCFANQSLVCIYHQLHYMYM